MNRKFGLCLLFLLLPTCIFFGPILMQDHTFAYRDSARFYYRQFEWNQSQWKQGEVPLWNAQENLGTPVVAEASSSVFYPMQALFLIPGIKFSKAFVLYAAIHVYLASIGAFLLAYSLGCKNISALFCGTCYSLSGSLIFQTCNIVFLVGGCWLPFGIWMSYRLTLKPGVRRAIGLAFFLALAVLGGDPQTAYHIGIASFILVVLAGRQNFSGRAKTFGKTHAVIGWHTAAAIIAFCLAAIQILPSWNATRKSTRAYFENARSVWELSDAKSKSSTEGIFGHPVASTHHDHLYQFSQAPWTGMELIWPNVSGKIQPSHSRWSESIPASSRTWTPSIYCGLLPFVFFLSALFRKTPMAKDRWVKISFLVFAIGSMGWFGIGWLVHEFSYWAMGADPAKSSMGAPVGGIYWFFVVLLPGYVNFRYPAKLFVVATLFLCVLAAREFQMNWREEGLRRIKWILNGVMVLTVALVVTLWLSSIPINQWLQGQQFRAANEFGPLDAQAVWSTVIWAFIHTGIIGFVAVNFLNQEWKRQTVALLFLALTLVDLSHANRQLIVTARSSLWDRKLDIEEYLEQKDGGMIRVYRTDPMTWSTRSNWMKAGAENRMEQIVDYEVQTLMPKNHLRQTNSEHKIGVVESFRTIEDLRFATLMAYIKSQPGITTKDSFDVYLAPYQRVLSFLGCEYLLIPKWGKPGPASTTSRFESKDKEFVFTKNDVALSRIRIVPRVYEKEPIDDFVSWASENQHMLRAATHLLFEDIPYVECLPDDEITKDDRIVKNGTNTIRVIEDSNTRIELQLEQAQGMLIIADTYDEDWVAHSVDQAGEKKELPVFRANFVMRAIALPEPNMRIVLEYRPRWVTRGAYISVIALFLTFVIYGSAVFFDRKKR